MILIIQPTKRLSYVRKHCIICYRWKRVNITCKLALCTHHTHLHLHLYMEEDKCWLATIDIVRGIQSDIFALDWLFFFMWKTKSERSRSIMVTSIMHSHWTKLKCYHITLPLHLHTSQGLVGIQVIASLLHILQYSQFLAEADSLGVECLVTRDSPEPYGLQAGLGRSENRIVQEVPVWV